MANYLASIYGTEQDKVNCSFYYKIGACRHGDKCSRKHIKPTYSQTILCQNMYQNPSLIPGNKKSEREIQKIFDEFFEDVYCETSKYGKVEEIVVCENTNEHLMGNVYCRFKYEEDAEKCRDEFNSRWYGGRPVYAELSPVTDFKEACCRQHDTHECNRGGLCNFIHARRPTPALLHSLEQSQKKYLLLSGKDDDSDDSPSPDRRRRRR
jgi:splicing factor U2AF subunit